MLTGHYIHEKNIFYLLYLLNKVQKDQMKIQLITTESVG